MVFFSELESPECLDEFQLIAISLENVAKSVGSLANAIITSGSCGAEPYCKQLLSDEVFQAMLGINEATECLTEAYKNSNNLNDSMDDVHAALRYVITKYANMCDAITPATAGTTGPYDKCRTEKVFHEHAKIKINFSKVLASFKGPNAINFSKTCESAGILDNIPKFANEFRNLARAVRCECSATLESVACQFDKVADSEERVGRSILCLQKEKCPKEKRKEKVPLIQQLLKSIIPF